MNPRQLVAQQQGTVELAEPGFVQDRILTELFQGHPDAGQSEQCDCRSMAAAAPGEHPKLASAQVFQAGELLAHQQVDLLVEEMGHVADAIASARILARLGQELENVAVQDRKIDTTQIEEVAHVAQRARPGNRQDADVAKLSWPLGQRIGGARGATVGIGYGVGKNGNRANGIGRSGPRRLRRQGDKGDRACQHWQRQAAHSG